MTDVIKTSKRLTAREKRIREHLISELEGIRKYEKDAQFTIGYVWAGLRALLKNEFGVKVDPAPWEKP